GTARTTRAALTRHGAHGLGGARSALVLGLAAAVALLLGARLGALLRALGARGQLDAEVRRRLDGLGGALAALRRAAALPAGARALDRVHELALAHLGGATHAERGRESLQLGQAHRGDRLRTGRPAVVPGLDGHGGVGGVSHEGPSPRRRRALRPGRVLSGLVAG